MTDYTTIVFGHIAQRCTLQVSEHIDLGMHASGQPDNFMLPVSRLESPRNSTRPSEFAN